MRVRRRSWLLVAAVAAGLLASPLWAAGSGGSGLGPGIDEFDSTAEVKLELLGLPEETITMKGPVRVQRGALQPDGTIDTEMLALDLQGTSVHFGRLVLRAGTSFGGEPVSGKLENVVVDAKGNLVGADSSFTFTQLFMSAFGRQEGPGAQEFHASFTVQPPLVVASRVYGPELPPNVPVTLSPLGRLDHFKCYTVKSKRGFKPQSVKLGDQFQSAAARLVRPLTLCAPVSKNGEKLRLPQAHLKCYGITSKSPQPKKDEVEVEVTNQFGSEKLIVLQPRTLCAPTLKKRVKTVPAKLVPPPGSPGGLTEHFTCYDVKPKAAFGQRVVSLSDQFEVERAKVLRPVSLCAPVEKNGVKIRDSGTHLTCYAIQDASRKLKPGGRLVVVRNQFGTEVLEVRGSQTLCVPSQKRPPCSEYAERTKAELLLQGQQAGRINEAIHIPFQGAKDSPCE